MCQGYSHRLQPHTVYENWYCIGEFHSHLLQNLLPDEILNDSLCRQQLWSQLIRNVTFKKGSSRTRRFENDLQVTRLWPHHERVPRPSHKPGRNHKAHVRVSTKECPFCPFCFSIFVLFLNIYCQLVTTIFIDPGDYNFQAPPHLYSGEIWKRRLWGFGERNTRSLSWTMASRDFPFPRFHPALI